MQEQPVGTSTANKAAAYHEAAEREMALNDALAGHSPKALELPVLRQPLLPGKFQERLDELDKEIYGRGVAISRERLLSLGRSRFTEMLTKDRIARSLQRVVSTGTDLTSWPSVEFSFAEAGALTTSVRKRRNAEVNAGIGEDREAAARIAGFEDLWKTTQEPASVRNVLAFHDAFSSLVLGQSLLERLGDGRARSYSLAGGAKAEFFTDWLSALDGAHFTVKLNDPLWHIMAWLAGETTSPPTTLAQDFFRVRVPDREQLTVADATWRGFLLGHDGWSLWNVVGRGARKATHVELLETWGNELARRYRAIQAFHDETRTAFNRPVSGPSYCQVLRFDAAAHRGFLDKAVQTLMSQLSGLLALKLEEMLPGTVVGRFQSCWLLCEVNSARARNYPRDYVDPLIGEWLEEVFPGVRFFHEQFTVTELPG